MTPTYLRIKPQVVIPWHSDYVIQRSVRQVSPVGLETSVALLVVEGGELKDRHDLEEPEASVFWDWLVGDRQLEPNAAGVLDLCRPEGALREAQAALGVPSQEVPWDLPASVPPPAFPPYGSSPMSPSASPEPYLPPAVDYAKVRQQIQRGGGSK